MSNDLFGASWFKSRRSANQDACVEAAHLTGSTVGVRDSKDPTGPALIFGPGEWDDFVAGVRSGKFDLR
ncbi:DUF397 domain-containing protein [Nocardia uniformis]|uniref:DUF397 domain-containing protein n=1 Tax=Nocardia uniformis TaxID=53432 RepID=A0A849C4U1_9NOCA|nr:DUF397 domain-containing protein [Nocardia uniformis]